MIRWDLEARWLGQLHLGGLEELALDHVLDREEAPGQKNKRNDQDEDR